ATARRAASPPRGPRSRPKAKTHFSTAGNRPPTGNGMAGLSDTPPRGARSRPKAKSILLSTEIARLLATEWPASRTRRLAALVRGRRPKAFFSQHESPAYWRRHGPPLEHAVSRPSFAAGGQNACPYQQISPAYWRRNGTP